MTDNDVQALKELMNARFDALDKALTIQSKEYERRLDFLNGEAERLRSMQATYLPRELYDTEHRELKQRVEKHQSFIDNMQGRIIVIPAVVSFVIAALGWLITFLVN